MFSSGRMPVRHPHVDLGLPTNGHRQVRVARVPRARTSTRTGRRPRTARSSTGTTSRRPAGRRRTTTGPTARCTATSCWSARSNAPATHTLASTVGAMNRAATQDLRAAQAFRGVVAVLETGPAPNARVRSGCIELLRDWRDAGVEPAGPRPQRHDRPPRGGDHGQGMAQDRGRGDGPGAGSAARRPGLADGPRQPRQQPGLGVRQRLVRLRRQGPAHACAAGRSPGGSRRSFCGAGDLAACRDSLWAALDQAGRELEDELGEPEPGRLAGRRHGREDLLLARASSGPRCAGPTGPRSSRRSATRATAKGWHTRRRASGPGASARAAPPRPRVSWNEYALPGEDLVAGRVDVAVGSAVEHLDRAQRPDRAGALAYQARRDRVERRGDVAGRAGVASPVTAQGTVDGSTRSSTVPVSFAAGPMRRSVIRIAVRGCTSPL